MYKRQLRNRAVVVAATAVLTALLAGLVATAHQARLAGAAATEAVRSNAVLLDVLSGFDRSWADQSRDTRESLELASRSIASLFPRDPRLQAEAAVRIGRLYARIEDWSGALACFERAREVLAGHLEPADPARLEVELEFVQPLRHLRGVDAAAAHGESLHARLLEHAGPRARLTQRVALALAKLRGQQSRSGEAEALLRSVLAHGGSSDRDLRIDARKLLGCVLLETGRYAESEPVLVESLHELERAWGPDHEKVHTLRSALALLLQRTGRLAEAVEAQREAHRGLVRVHGWDHPMSTGAELILAMMVILDGRVEEAEAILGGFLFRTRAGRIELSLVDCDTSVNAIELLLAAGRVELPLAFARWLAEAAESQLGHEPLRVLGARHALARCLAAAGDWEAARDGFLELVEDSERLLPPGHPSAALLACNLGEHLLDRGLYAEARPHLAGALPAARALRGGGNGLSDRARELCLRLVLEWEGAADLEPLLYK